MEPTTPDDMYRQLWQAHGPTLPALGWSSPSAQLVRFNVLVECYVTPGPVLDVGCGFGDLSLFFAPEDYVGIDSNPRFIEEAQRKYPNNTFVVADVMQEDVGQSEYVLASGLMSFQNEPLKLVLRLWELTKSTLAFNWHRTSLPDINLALTSCQSKYHSIRHDYLPDDYTVFMHREPPQLLHRP